MYKVASIETIFNRNNNNKNRKDKVEITMFQRTSSSYQLASKISKSSQTNKYQQLRIKIMTLIPKNIVIILVFELR